MMKKLTFGLMALIIFLPLTSFAQSTPQPPASWIAFQKQESAKRQAFYQQMKADREAFLNANPDVKSYLDQLRASNQSRIAAWREAHQKNTPGSMLRK